MSDGPNPSGTHLGGDCHPPKLRWWYGVGRVWCCPTCHKLWFVGHWYSCAWGDLAKEWTAVDGSR